MDLVVPIPETEQRVDRAGLLLLVGEVTVLELGCEQFADLFQNMKGALPPVQAAEPQEEADDEEI